MNERDINVIDMDFFRKVFLKYTKKAFQLIPIIKNPKILDIGCGTGIPTIELARLSGGEIIAMDINTKDLQILDQKIKKKKLSNQIRIVNASLLKNKFDKNSFDLIWAEGVFHIIGFEKSFDASQRILKKMGYLVLNESIKKISPYLHDIDKFGYIKYKTLQSSQGVWWDEFYKPLEKEINRLLDDDPKLINNAQIRRYRREISMVKSNPKEFDTAFYILQKV
ncbi:MAG: methyltransferase domain-containing protein [Candidatus Lokiarchaeota archaeon]|nr:methyltransferase domain-containing protein [Candidatus Lokiarchaeota archaeon]